MAALSRLCDMFIPLMSSGDVPTTPSREEPADIARRREELVHRVASSATFEKSPRLRAFFLHVCRCALENKPEEATEQQIGIHVYDRSPGYNPNEDNVVRTAARSLRMKLEHHFANEGKDEPVIIAIPKGRYLPVFEGRSEQAAKAVTSVSAGKGKVTSWRPVVVAVAGLIIVAGLWFGYEQFQSRIHPPQPIASAAGGAPQGEQVEGYSLSRSELLAVGSGTDEIRIAAGRTTPYVDVHGRRWEADRYYEGGVSRPGPVRLFPAVSDPGLFKTMREAESADAMAPQLFRYDIPLRRGVYELRLYFADPLRQTDKDPDPKGDAQNLRHFQVTLNGHPVLLGFDAVADAGSAAATVRVFKDVVPAADGKLHLEFTGGQRPFVNAIELTPGTPGKLNPIRIVAQKADIVDKDGTHWNSDEYFVYGRTWVYTAPPPEVSPLYFGERHGNFTYAIPVAPGSYTLRLHFMEAFFSPSIPASSCRGAGCRVFDVTCNGVMLLQDFDILQAAQGALKPVIREFHGLRPNGQGKLLISFSPKVDYAEIRAIEVIDEAK